MDSRQWSVVSFGGSIVEGAFDRHSTALQDVSVDHGRLDILVPEQFLDGANVVSTLQEMGRKGVTKRMRSYVLVDLCTTGGFTDGFLDDRFVNVMPAMNPGASVL